jgi:lysozyme family protein
MIDDFLSALKFVLRWEGGFSDNPQDHGGRTMKGVTQREYDTWRVAQAQPAQDVAQISTDELTKIYFDEYWRPSFCDRLQAKLDLVQFDTCVNMGKNRAIKILQETVGVTPDGAFGPLTEKACEGCNPPEAVARYCSIREALYRRFAEAPGQAIFLKGWLNRLNDLRIEAGIIQQRGPRGPADFGDTDHIERIPDLAADEPLEQWC